MADVLSRQLSQRPFFIVSDHFCWSLSSQHVILVRLKCLPRNRYLNTNFKLAQLNRRIVQDDLGLSPSDVVNTGRCLTYWSNIDQIFCFNVIK